MMTLPSGRVRNQAIPPLAGRGLEERMMLPPFLNSSMNYVDNAVR